MMNVGHRRSRSFRNEISVEKADTHVLRRPFGDGIWIGKYCVPNGTPWRMCASVFYRYYIPKGMTALKRHFRDNLTLHIPPRIRYIIVCNSFNHIPRLFGAYVFYFFCGRSGIEASGLNYCSCKHYCSCRYY